MIYVLNKFVKYVDVVNKINNSCCMVIMSQDGRANLVNINLDKVIENLLYLYDA